jgi:two-component system sensor histidine kinase KdpD
VRAAQLAAQSQKLQKALFDSVSHELKTPLATISGALEQPQPDQTEIRHAVRRLTRTVDHLLDATRLESGLLKPSSEWCDPGELAREAIALADPGGHQVAIHVSPGVPVVCVDAGLLEQAISTLVHNAACYSPPGQPIELHVSPDRDAILISVLDRGAGLMAGEEETIFEKFHRGRNAAPGGLGLGLAIARQLVELHGGTLTAHNRAGGGAVFTIRLPLGEPMRLPEEKTA